MKYSRDYFFQDTVFLAKDLLGSFLCRRYHGVLLKSRIVETEAYVGTGDKACHASKGCTRRTEVMFGEGGHAYVYLIYGMYYCFNVVTGVEGYPAAVLVRALEPVEGVEVMQELRPVKKEYELSSGPGKLCQAMAIDRSLQGVDIVTGEELWLERGEGIPSVREVVAARRVGVEYAGEDALLPWRFYVKNNPFVSKR